jgi:flagellar hook-length control protein FliK
MLQAPNLLDLFANHRKDAQAKAAQSHAADAKGQAARAGSSDLLPIETSRKASDKGNGAASAPSSFQSKVKESRAKLAARAQKTAHQNRTPDVMTDKPAARSESQRLESKRPARAERIDRADRPDQTRPAAGKPQNAPDTASADKPDSRPDGFRADQNDSRIQNENRAADCAAEGGMDGAVADADAVLKQSLADAGIHASDEQLQDPEMLAEILAMLQGMFLQQGLEFDSAPDAPATTGMEELPVDDVMPDAPSAPAGEAQAPQTPADAPAVSKDVFALVQEKIAELARNNPENQNGIVRPQTSPLNTPAGWQGVKVRAQTESVSLDSLPMADLDRLRVLQASALQAAAYGKESEITTLELPGDEGSMDAIPESGLESIANAGNESSGGNDAQAQADLFGRNGDKAGNAEASASKEGPLVAKDGATGQLFHNTVEQAKSAEHRAGIERAWEPRQAHDASTMEQLAGKLSAKGLKNGDEISVQLSPEHLGKVRVSLEMKEGSMSARISVENDAARQQVEAGLATLRDSLESQGIKLQGLEVSVDQRQSSLFNPDGSNSESFFQRNGRGRAGTEGSAEAIPFESAPESDTGRRMGYNTMEYIG